MPPRIWELGAGCLIFLTLRHQSRLSDRLKTVPPSVVASILIATLFIPLSHAVPATIAVVSMTVCLLACLQPGKAWYGLFTRPQIVYLGLISYSLYLWHWGVLCISRWTIGIHWWTWPLQVALMLGLAIGSYRYVEQPLRKIHKPLKNNAHVISTGMLTTIGSALLLFGMGTIAEINLFIGRSYPDINFGEIPNELKSKPSASKIFVLGNSYAHHLLPLVSSIAKKNHLAYEIMPPSSAPIPMINGSWRLMGSALAPEKPSSNSNPSLANSDKDSATASYAPTIEKEAKNVLSKLKPHDILILSSRHFSMYAVPFVHHGSTYYLEAKGDRGERLSTRALLLLWRKKLQLITSLASNREANVIFIMQPPEFRRELTSNLLCSKQWYRPTSPPDCVLSADRDRLQHRFLGDTAKILTELQKTNLNFFVYDPFGKLCPPSRSQCSTNVNGVPRFSDNDHLSRDGSLLLEEDFTGFLSRHGLLQSRAH
jgi:hypothetical protein